MARTVAVTGSTTSTASARRTVGSRSTAASSPRTTATSDRASRSFQKGADEGLRRSGGRSAGRGFNAFKQAAKESAPKTDFGTFTVPYDEVKVVVFLEPDNYTTVWRHWVPTVLDDGRKVDVPRNCIDDEKNDVRCPLCSRGDIPKPVAFFNIVDLDEPGKVQVWEASAGIFGKIDELADTLKAIPEDRGGPLALNSEGIYAAVSKKKKETKTGKGGFTEYTVLRVKERDLDEDHGLDPLDADQIEELLEHLFTEEDVQYNTVEELRDLVAKIPD
jgi:hypothetical protein